MIFSRGYSCALGLVALGLLGQSVEAGVLPAHMVVAGSSR